MRMKCERKRKSACAGVRLRHDTGAKYSGCTVLPEGTVQSDKIHNQINKFFPQNLCSLLNVSLGLIYKPKRFCILSPRRYQLLNQDYNILSSPHGLQLVTTTSRFNWFYDSIYISFWNYLNCRQRLSYACVTRIWMVKNCYSIPFQTVTFVDIH